VHGQWHGLVGSRHRQPRLDYQALADRQKLRPVEYMERWLEAASITEGRVFRAVLRGGRVRGSLTPECLSRAVKKLAARIAMDAKTGERTAFALDSSLPASRRTRPCSRSPRGGRARRGPCARGQPAAEHRAALIAAVTRHKSLSMLQAYNRRHNLFADYAASSWV
jgi:hypothetical protein